MGHVISAATTQTIIPHPIHAENQESPKCQPGCHQWHQRSLSWQPTEPPRMTKLLQGQLHCKPLRSPEAVRSLPRTIRSLRNLTCTSAVEPKHLSNFKVAQLFKPPIPRPQDPMRPNNNPNIKVHGANMGPNWVLSAPDGPHVGPMNFDIRKDIPSDIKMGPWSHACWSSQPNLRRGAHWLHNACPILNQASRTGSVTATQ